MSCVYYVAVSAFTPVHDDLGYCNLCWDSQVTQDIDLVLEKKTHRMFVCICVSTHALVFGKVSHTKIMMMTMLC